MKQAYYAFPIRSKPLVTTTLPLVTDCESTGAPVLGPHASPRARIHDHDVLRDPVFGSGHAGTRAVPGPVFLLIRSGLLKARLLDQKSTSEQNILFRAQ